MILGSDRIGPRRNDFTPFLQNLEREREREGVGVAERERQSDRQRGGESE